MDMEPETDLSIENNPDSHAQPLAPVKRRRSSIFRPDEDYNDSALEKDYPTEYREQLEKELQEWGRLLNQARHDYKATKIRSQQPQDFKIDETILDKYHLDFLKEGSSSEQYLKIVDDFLNNLQLYKAVQEIDVKAKQVERKRLLSKINYIENTLLDHLYNGCNKEE